MYSNVWVIFDKDDYSNLQFNNAIINNPYNSGWSNLNFELWILAHFKKINNYISKEKVFKELQNEFIKEKLGDYNKNDKYIFDNVKSRLNIAIDNCREMVKLNADIVQAYDKNPCTMFFIY